MSEIVIVGGGIASFVAGLELLERLPHARVTLLTAQSQTMVGGQLASWDEHGYPIEHGLHALFGFYDTLIPRLRKVGAMDHFTRSPNAVHVWERGALRRFQPRSWLATYDGFSLREKSGLARFAPTLVKLVGEVARRGMDALDDYDGWDLREFAREHGIGESLLSSNFVRSLYDGPFNHPGPLAASVGLEGLYRIFSRPWHWYFDGPSSTCLIEPLRDAFVRAGGQICFEQRLLALRCDAEGRRIEALVVRDDSGGGVRTLCPDETIIAVGLADFPSIDLGGLESLPYFRRIAQLPTVSTLSLQAWFRIDPVPRGVDTMMVGMPEPLSILCPATRVRPIGPSGRHLPYEIIATGAEAGFEHWSDAAIVERFFVGLRRAGFDVPDGWSFDARAPASCFVHLRRNREPLHRYLAPRPGQLALRPQPRSPLENLCLAGAWTRNQLALPCAESAAQSAVTAATIIVERDRGSPVDLGGIGCGAPLVRPPPYRFEDARAIVATLPADADVLRTWLPPGLVTSRGFASRLVLVVAEYDAVWGEQDPAQTIYAYREVVLAAVVSAPGLSPSVLPLVVYVDDDAALAAGRETYGFPKKIARIERTAHSCVVERSGRHPTQEASRRPQQTTLLRATWDCAAGARIPNGAARWRWPWPAFVNVHEFPDATVARGSVVSRLMRVAVHDVEVRRVGIVRDVVVELGATREDPIRALVPNGCARVRRGLEVSLGFTMGAAETLSGWQQEDSPSRRRRTTSASGRLRTW